MKWTRRWANITRLILNPGKSKSGIGNQIKKEKKIWENKFDEVCFGGSNDVQSEAVASKFNA